VGRRCRTSRDRLKRTKVLDQKRAHDWALSRKRSSPMGMFPVEESKPDTTMLPRRITDRLALCLSDSLHRDDQVGPTRRPSATLGILVDGSVG